MAYAYERLNAISPNFTIAAAFGNVHGVYKPGNVKLTPTILRDSQQYVAEKFNTPEDNPLFFVFHGGSGSSPEHIKEAISYGVIKMNIDTDTQWATWEGVHTYYNENKEYLQGQLGNPEGMMCQIKNIMIHAFGCVLGRYHSLIGSSRHLLI